MSGRKKYPSDPNITFEETLRLIVHLRDSWRLVAADIEGGADTPAARIAEVIEQARNEILGAMK